MEKAKKSTNKLSFEEMIKELESIVSLLEAGDVPLEKSLELFQRGVTLTTQCNGKLSEAQGMVNLLCKNKQGEIEEIPFKLEDEENI